MRRNTLTVLTHLILNDQVKVKGQISEIALCLSDHDLRIAGKVHLRLLLIFITDNWSLFGGTNF